MANKALKSLDFGSGDVWFPLPIVNEGDNDKVLMVENGEWKAVQMISGNLPTSGQYVWSRKGMTEDVTTTTGEAAYILTTTDDTKPSCELEYSANAPVYEDGTWKMPGSTIVTIVNTDTVVPSETNVYVRLTTDPAIWYFVTSFYPGNLNSSGLASHAILYDAKYEATISDTVEYVIDDDPAKYPDSGWQDGYLYEAVKVGGREQGMIVATTTGLTLTIPTNLKSVSRVIITSGTSSKSFSSFSTPYPIMAMISQNDPLVNYEKTGSYAATHQPKTFAMYPVTSGGISMNRYNYALFNLADGVVTISFLPTGTSYNFYKGFEYTYDIYE